MILLLSLVLASPDARGPDPGATGTGVPGRRTASAGDLFMQQGQPRQAIAAYEAELKKSDTPPAHVGLGRAYARVGRCEPALEHFWPYLGMKAFTSEAATAAATCAARLGLHDDALIFAEYASERKEDNAAAHTTYILSLDSQGRADLVERELGVLASSKPDRDASFYARSVIALRRGDIADFDILMREWPTTQEQLRNRWGLIALSWLDVDDPFAAANYLTSLKRIRRTTTVRVINGEALRREGETWQAWDVFEGRFMVNEDSLDGDAVKARILADQGDLAAAEAILDGYFIGSDPDLIASAWYLAWHRRDTAAMREWRDLYVESRVSPLRNLYKLIPLPWRLGHVPGQAMPAPPDPESLRAQAAAAKARAAERPKNRSLPVRKPPKIRPS